MISDIDLFLDQEKGAMQNMNDAKDFADELPHGLIDAFNSQLRVLHERGQPENFVHAIHQFIVDYDRWRNSTARTVPDDDEPENNPLKRLAEKWEKEPPDRAGEPVKVQYGMPERSV